jgi:hypothetical protein
MTEADTTISDLQNKIRALELDRDYWRDQHDLVMQDWRADIEAWSAARTDLVAHQTAAHAALTDLLRFFDPATGAVSVRQGRDFLGDAFIKAHRIYGQAATRTQSAGPQGSRSNPSPPRS